ncbi:MAG: DUF2130 domain-containing protein [Rhizomicrobium sp.]
MTESLAAPLLEATRLEFQRKLAEQGAEISRREAAVRAQEAAVAKAKGAIDDQVAAKLKAERQRISADELKRARLLVAADFDQKAREVTDLQEMLRQRDATLGEAQQTQAELVRKQRELDEAIREVSLTVEKRVSQSLEAIRTKARKEAEDELKLTISEKDQTIDGMKRTIEELKRRSEQGSQQLQGDVQELELETLLRNRFPRDSIERVGKGKFGGDVLQTVYGPSGQSCGSILSESKRTRNWSDGWLAKLRGDQRKAGADIALIVSQALPEGLATVTALAAFDSAFVAINTMAGFGRSPRQPAKRLPFPGPTGQHARGLRPLASGWTGPAATGLGLNSSRRSASSALASRSSTATVGFSSPRSSLLI